MIIWASVDVPSAPSFSLALTSRFHLQNCCWLDVFFCFSSNSREKSALSEILKPILSPISISSKCSWFLLPPSKWTGYVCVLDSSMVSGICIESITLSYTIPLPASLSRSLALPDSSGLDLPGHHSTTHWSVWPYITHTHPAARHTAENILTHGHGHTSTPRAIPTAITSHFFCQPLQHSSIFRYCGVRTEGWLIYVSSVCGERKSHRVVTSTFCLWGQEMKWIQTLPALTNRGKCSIKICFITKNISS